MNKHTHTHTLSSPHPALSLLFFVETLHLLSVVLLAITVIPCNQLTYSEDPHMLLCRAVCYNCILSTHAVVLYIIYGMEVPIN